jgi:hypothetical protein
LPSKLEALISISSTVKEEEGGESRGGEERKLYA